MYPFTQPAFVENLLCASIVLDPGDPNRKDTTLDLERSQFWEEAWRGERLDNRGLGQERNLKGFPGKAP